MAYFDEFQPTSGEAPAAGAPPRDITGPQRDILIRTVIGEAGNQPDVGQQAVANVVLNRADSGKFGGNTVDRVVLAPHQFEPWQTRASSLLAIRPDSPAYQRAAANVDKALGGADDPTGGALYFLEPNTVRARTGGTLPSWAQGDQRQIGAHIFYAGPGNKLSDPEAKAAPGQSATQPSAGYFSEFQPEAPAAAPGPPPGAPPVSAEFGGPPPPQAPQQFTPTQAFVGGAQQGVAAGFLPQVAGAGAAGTAGLGRAGTLLDVLPGGGMAKYPIGVLRLLYEKSISGPGNATEAYQRGRDTVKAQLGQMQEQQPGAYLGGEITGAVGSALVTPEIQAARALPAVARAGELAQTAGRGALSLGQKAGLGAARATDAALTGGAYGAVSGAGETEGTLPERLQGAVKGAETGVLTGGILSPVTGLLGRVAGTIGKVTKAVTPAVTRGTAEEKAAQQVVDAFAKDNPGLANPAEHVAQAMADAAAGKPTDVNLTGPAVQEVIQSVTAKSPEAAQAMRELADQQTLTQGERLKGEIVNILGHEPNVQARINEVNQIGQAEVTPAYLKAMSLGNKPIITTELQRLANDSPAVQSAMREAIPESLDEAARHKMTAPVTPQVDANGNISFKVDSNGKPQYPSLMYWDQVQRSLRKRAEAEGVPAEQAARIGDLRRTLNDELTTQVPEFRAAQESALGKARAQDAIDFGTKLYNDPRDDGVLRNIINKMSPGERELQQEASAAHLLQMIDKSGDRANVFDAIAASEAARKRLEVMLGPDGARRLEAFGRIRGMENDLAKAAAGKPPDKLQQLAEGITHAAVGEHGQGITKVLQAAGASPLASVAGAGAIQLGANELGLEGGNKKSTDAISAALLVNAARGRAGKLAADRIGELLKARTPEAMREIARIASRDPRIMDAIRRTDRVITRGITTSVPATEQQQPKPMASGGIVNKPTVALIGEAGPEAVIPLDKKSETLADIVDEPPAYNPALDRPGRLTMGHEMLLPAGHVVGRGQVIR